MQRKHKPSQPHHQQGVLIEEEGYGTKELKKMYTSQETKAPIHVGVCTFQRGRHVLNSLIAGQNIGK